MKLKVFIGALLWALLISVLHIHTNIGWERAGRQLKVLFGLERAELLVGFLPVT